MGKFEFDFTGHSQSEFDIQHVPLPAQAANYSSSAFSSSTNDEHIMSEDQLEISTTHQVTSQEDFCLYGQVPDLIILLVFRRLYTLLCVVL